MIKSLMLIRHDSNKKKMIKLEGEIKEQEIPEIFQIALARIPNKINILIMGNFLPFKQNQQLINHPRFRQAEIFLEENVIKTKITLLDKEELENWIQSLEKMKGLNHEFLLNAKAYSNFETHLCGNSLSLRITYENYPYILIDEIHHRFSIKKYFQQNEVWYLVLCLVSASYEFFRKDLSLGDVRPHNIFFNENGSIKIAHRFSWPAEQSNLQKTKYLKTVTFLAPEEMEELSSGKLYNQKNLKRSEAFSVGLSLLSIMYLQDLSSFYNVDKLEFDRTKLKDRIENITKQKYQEEATGKKLRYSEQLLTIVIWLTEVQPDKRISCFEVYKLLLPYKNRIQKFEKFEFKIPQSWKKSQSINTSKRKTKNQVPDNSQSFMIKNKQIPFQKKESHSTYPSQKYTSISMRYTNETSKEYDPMKNQSFFKGERMSKNTEQEIKRSQEIGKRRQKPVIRSQNVFL